MKRHRRLILFAGTIASVFVVSAVLAYSIPSLLNDAGPDAARAGHSSQVAAPGGGPLRTPGPPTWTIEDAEKFTDFPLYWLGSVFEELPLTQIIRYQFTPPTAKRTTLVPENSVLFIYGECSPQLQHVQSCRVPMSIMIEPHCTRSKQLTPDVERLGASTSVRGVPARQFDDSQIAVWTGDVTITLILADPSVKDAADVASALQPVSADSSNGDKDFPAPDLSPCY